jgi:hypothetical protein
MLQTLDLRLLDELFHIPKAEICQGRYPCYFRTAGYFEMMIISHTVVVSFVGIII